MEEPPPSVVLHLDRWAGNAVFVVRGDDLVIRFETTEGAHRLRMLRVSDVAPLIAARFDWFQLRIEDRNAGGRTQIECHRYRVGIGGEEGFAAEDFVFAGAVEYLGPDDSLPRRWPDRADAWEHTALPLDFGG